jgi:hypothetical protein
MRGSAGLSPQRKQRQGIAGSKGRVQTLGTESADRVAGRVALIVEIIGMQKSAFEAGG